MRVQLNALKDHLSVHVSPDPDHGVFVTLGADGIVTKHDSVCIQHADPAYLAGVFEEAAAQLRALTVGQAA
jgi:hypothetical protein